MCLCKHSFQLVMGIYCWNGYEMHSWKLVIFFLELYTWVCLETWKGSPYTIHKISLENLATLSLISDIKRRANVKQNNKENLEDGYLVQPMILFCLLPTFPNQNSKVRTHSTATKYMSFSTVKEKVQQSNPFWHR
jgi:hypothetical protein